MLLPLLLCGVAGLVAVLRLLYSYGNWRRCSWYVQLASVTSWYLPFTIIFILPFDFSSSLYRRCEHDCNAPMGYISDQFTRSLWAAVYWTMYLLTWLIIPIMISYVDSGAFSFKARLRESAWSNFQFYGASGVIGLVIIIYIASTKGLGGTDLVAFLMAAANFWGLLLVILFMGFGLVSVPRRLWKHSSIEYELRKIERRALAYKDKAYESELELSEVVNEVSIVSTRIEQTDDLRPCIDLILDKCLSKNSRTTTATRASMLSASRIPGEISETYLTGLHNRVKQAVLKEERDRWRWNSSMRRAFFLQDVLASRANPSRQFESNLSPWSEWNPTKRSVVWWWYVVLRTFVYRTLAICAAIFSISILWSEMTFNFTSPHLSIVHHLLRSFGLSYVSIETASVVIIGYMCICSYTSVMHLKIFNIYSLETHHHTNERSLLFCGAYLCRLMFPLCYNFLTMIGEDDVTEFAKFMGQIDLVPFLGEQPNRVIPILTLAPAALAAFNIHNRVMRWFTVDSVGSSDSPVDETDAELGPLALPYEEGRALILEARRSAERQQGVDTHTQYARRYSPATSAHSSTINFRGHISSSNATLEQSDSGTRNPREWHMGRPSLEHLQDEPSNGIFNQIAAQDTASSSPFLGGASSGTSNNDAKDDDVSCDDDDDDASDSNGNSTKVLTGQKPTGMAARLGRWLPRQASSRQVSKSGTKKTLLSTNAGIGRSNSQAKLRSNRPANWSHLVDVNSPAAALRAPSPDLFLTSRYQLPAGYTRHRREGSEGSTPLSPLLGLPPAPPSQGGRIGSLRSGATTNRAVSHSPNTIHPSRANVPSTQYNSNGWTASAATSHYLQQRGANPRLTHSPSSPRNPSNPWSELNPDRFVPRKHALSDSPASTRVTRTLSRGNKI